VALTLQTKAWQSSRAATPWWRGVCSAIGPVSGRGRAQALDGMRSSTYWICDTGCSTLQIKEIHPSCRPCQLALVGARAQALEGMARAVAGQLAAAQRVAALAGATEHVRCQAPLPRAAALAGAAAYSVELLDMRVRPAASGGRHGGGRARARGGG